jgi:dTDP-4-amino-4,6-dideoxygalactose transaminase
LKEKITLNTKAIIPVHLFGLCAEMDTIREVAEDIPIIEDAACASGAGYKGNPAGGLGTMACFSFHPRKSVTTGEGGMVTTNDDGLAAKLKMLRNHGASVSEEERHKGPKPYILPDFNLMGFNYRMTDLQGAVGVIQIKKLDQFIDERDRWTKYYFENLSHIDWLTLPEVPAGLKHGWQSFVVMVDESKAPSSRNEIMEILQSKGISTRPGTHAIHMINFYQERFRLKDDDFPQARLANNYSMAIPLHNRMTEDDYKYIVEAIKNL